PGTDGLPPEPARRRGRRRSRRPLLEEGDEVLEADDQVGEPLLVGLGLAWAVVAVPRPVSAATSEGVAGGAGAGAGAGVAGRRRDDGAQPTSGSGDRRPRRSPRAPVGDPNRLDARRAGAADLLSLLGGRPAGLAVAEGRHASPERRILGGY